MQVGGRGPGGVELGVVSGASQTDPQSQFEPSAHGFWILLEGHLSRPSRRAELRGGVTAKAGVQPTPSLCQPLPLIVPSRVGWCLFGPGCISGTLVNVPSQAENTFLCVSHVTLHFACH